MRPNNNTSYRNLVRHMFLDTPHCLLMFVIYLDKQTEKFARHACHSAHWLQRCGMVSGFASSCMSARNDAQNDASRVPFLFEIQLIIQTNTSQEEAKEGEQDKETSSLNKQKRKTWGQKGGQQGGEEGRRVTSAHRAFCTSSALYLGSVHDTCPILGTAHSPAFALRGSCCNALAAWPAPTPAPCHKQQQQRQHCSAQA